MINTSKSPSATPTHVTPASGHLLFFDIEQPTRDMRVTFDYSDTDIDTVSAIDLIPSVRQSRIERTPEQLDNREVRVDIDGWTFPRSGVAFVWTLSGEKRKADGRTGRPHRPRTRSRDTS